MSKRVLLADDAPFMRKIQKTVLEANGFEVCGEAEDGFEVIEKYEELEPDVLILGLLLQKIDSMEVLKKIKKSYPEAKVIICSSTARQKHIVNTMRYGACNFIAKPFEADRLISIVSAAVESTRVANLLSDDALNAWCAEQKKYPTDENLSQEQVAEIINSYYELYSPAPASQASDAVSKDELLKKLEKLVGTEKSGDDAALRKALGELLQKYE